MTTSIMTKWWLLLRPIAGALLTAGFLTSQAFGQQTLSDTNAPTVVPAIGEVAPAPLNDQSGLGAKAVPGWTYDKIIVSPKKTTSEGMFNYELTKENGKWTFVRGEQSRSAYDTESVSFERISFNPSTMTIYLRFDNICQTGSIMSETECTCSRGLISTASRRRGYNLCSSEFRTAKAGAKNAATAALGAFLMMGTTVAMIYSVDSDQVLAAAKEANLLEAAQLDNYERYLAKYKNAQNSSKLMAVFIAESKVTNYDPDNLLASAEQSLSTLRQRDEEDKKAKRIAEYRRSFEGASNLGELQEFIRKYQLSDPDNLVPQAKIKLAAIIETDRKEAAAREVQARKAAAANQVKLVSWRKGIKIGTETFCGPVIEIRSPMIKVAVSAPLPGYPAEVWLKSNELYPEWMARCMNTNGHLSAIFD